MAAGPALEVVVVGATGAVGRALVEALEEAELPVGSLRLVASERSAGAEVAFRGEEVRVEAARPGLFAGRQLAFLAIPAAAARGYVAEALAAGCAVVDLSAASRADAAVPLVVAELNPTALPGAGARPLVATPGGGALQLAVALAPLRAEAGVERVAVTALESVSAAGSRGIEELEGELRAMLAFQEPPAPTALPHRIAFNVVPQVGAAELGGDSDEEASIAAEVRRVLDDPALRLAATAVRVPTFHGHVQVVQVVTRRKLSAADARQRLRAAPGVKVLDAPAEGVYPMPMLAVNDDAVLVGRIREDASQPNGLSMVVVADAVRRAAGNAIAVARRLVEGQAPRS